MKATWQGKVIADSDKTLEVGGYVYFPRDAVRVNIECQLRALVAFRGGRQDSRNAARSQRLAAMRLTRNGPVPTGSLAKPSGPSRAH